MMIQAVLGNPHHPEYGVATIPFPIPRDQHAHCMELLEALEIGDAVKADCKVEKIDSFYTVLKRVEMLTVNVEELNYLAKRLDSFDTGEAAQFQAMLWSPDIVALNKRISDLSNQNQTLAFLKQQGLVDPDIFIAKTNELTKQLRQAKLEKEKLMDAESDMTALQTRDLIDILEDGPEFLDSFDTELFGELVEKIIIESNDSVRFCLKNGLELRESIERTVR